MALLHLQRHSDHHAHPTRSYQVLRDCADVPQLPHSYFSMFLVALIPPLWFAPMNRRVAAWAGNTPTAAISIPQDRPFRQFCCITCGLIYDEKEGMPDEGFPPGTRWEDIPDDWTCSECSTSKGDFFEI